VQQTGHHCAELAGLDWLKQEEVQVEDADTAGKLEEEDDREEEAQSQQEKAEQTSKLSAALDCIPSA
jgi:hypothetical protein